MLHVLGRHAAHFFDFLGKALDVIQPGGASFTLQVIQFRRRDIPDFPVAQGALYNYCHKIKKVEVIKNKFLSPEAKREKIPRRSSFSDSVKQRYDRAMKGIPVQSGWGSNRNNKALINYCKVKQMHYICVVIDIIRLNSITGWRF